MGYQQGLAPDNCPVKWLPLPRRDLFERNVYWPTMKILVAHLLAVTAIFAQSPTPAESIEAARKGPESAAMKQRVAGMTVPAQVSVWGQDYLFLATSPSPVTISIDQQPQRPLAQVDADHWM